MSKEDTIMKKEMEMNELKPEELNLVAGGMTKEVLKRWAKRRYQKSMGMLPEPRWQGMKENRKRKNPNPRMNAARA